MNTSNKERKNIEKMSEDVLTNSLTEKYKIKFLKKYNKSPKKKIFINNIAESLGSLIANLINSVDPSMVVLGGGVVVKNENFRDKLIQYIRNFIFAKDLQSMKIKISKLGDHTGLIGPAALFK